MTITNELEELRAAVDRLTGIIAADASGSSLRLIETLNGELSALKAGRLDEWAFRHVEQTMRARGLRRVVLMPAHVSVDRPNAGDPTMPEPFRGPDLASAVLAAPVREGGA